MSKVIRKFRKNMDYDDVNSKKAYDKEYHSKKHEIKQKAKQNRNAKENMYDEVGFDNDYHNGNY